MSTPPHGLTDRRLGVALLIAAAPFAAVATFLHLRGPVHLAGEGVTWTHGIAAAIANLLGPWAAPLVRLVDFPNAGLRSFSLPGALGLTALLAALLVTAFRVRRGAVRWLCVALSVPLAAAWFFAGFLGIADGLL
ncbi:MAG: hypothetical protein HY721_34845 [Planctomycetes bacterium]|nr:hypothetical protein [Planctomycetota bacterium]